MQGTVLTKVIIGVVAVVAISSGIYYFGSDGSSSNSGEENSISGTQNEQVDIVETEENTFASDEAGVEVSETRGILEKLIAKESTAIVKCSYTIEELNSEFKDAEVFMKSSGEYRVNQGQNKAHMIARDNKLYIWGINGDMDFSDNTGMIIEYDPSDLTDDEADLAYSQGVISPEGMLALAEANADEDISNISCDYAKDVNDSIFDIPSEIEFISVSEMMQGMMQLED